MACYRVRVLGTLLREIPLSVLLGFSEYVQQRPFRRGGYQQYRGIR
jgi:hypothetical protein